MMARAAVLALILAIPTVLAGCSSPTADQAADPGNLSSSPSSTESGGPGSEGEDAVTVPAGFSPYWPIAVGNTWVYHLDYYGFDEVRVVIETRTIADVTAVDDGFRVLFDRAYHYEDGAFPDFRDSIELVFHADGSATLPYQSIPAPSEVMGNQMTVAVQSGSIEWPTVAELDAGAASTSTVASTLTVPSQVLDISTVITVTGAGTGDVTNGAGTFAARLLRQDELQTSSYISDVPRSTTYSIAPNIGPVRIVVIDEYFGSEVITIELLSFAPGD